MTGTGMRRGTSRSTWMLTFADLMSILLCFLVLAYGLNAAPEGTRERALSALREVFRPGASGQTGMAVPPQAVRGGNYWATWLKTRADRIPALAGQPVVVHGATASLALPEGAATLAEADVSALAALLNSGGVAITIRAGAEADTASGWAEAGRQAQTLAERLMEAGLREAPRIAVSRAVSGIKSHAKSDAKSDAGPRLAVEIGREEP